MADVLEGIAEGTNEWRNVSYVVRKAFGVLFAEVMGDRARAEAVQKQKQLSDAVQRIEALEGQVESIARSVSRLERQQNAALAKLEDTAAEQQRLARDSSKASLATGRARDTLESLTRKLREMPTMFEVTSLLDKRDEESGRGFAALAARNSLGVFPCVKWSAAGSTLATHNKTGAVEWTRREIISGDCRCFEWRSTTPHSIYVNKAGVYEVTAGVFSTQVPRMALRVNSDEVMVSRACRTYVTSKQGSGACSDAQCGKLCVTGQTICDLLWLPANSRLTVHIETDAHHAPAVRIKDAICIVRYVE